MSDACVRSSGIFCTCSFCSAWSQQCILLSHSCVCADTIGEFKRKIELVAGVPVAEQVLVVSRKDTLEDEAATLEDSGISEDRTMFLSFDTRCVL